MFVYIDESGITNKEAMQKYLVIALCVCNNKEFAQNMILEIRKTCNEKGLPITDQKELKYHELKRFQQEIAIRIINNKPYRNFYLVYVDVDKADKSLTTGKNEGEIQKLMLESMAEKFKEKLKEKDQIRIIADEKLCKASLEEIRKQVHEIRGSKKGISVDQDSSRKHYGLQLADLIAGSYRAKLMKKSDLLEVNERHVTEYKPKPNKK